MKSKNNETRFLKDESASPPVDCDELIRLKLSIHGAVQGVGFRPFIYKLASNLKLSGWVANDTCGVFIEVEGSRKCLQDFLMCIEHEKPPRAFIASMEHSYLDPAGYAKFEIRSSALTGKRTALILPDIATCPDCLTEIFNQNDRRYLYPFTNCTNCGPRYSIIEKLPYDRENTTMKNFSMCKECRKEYGNPLDRRFHAQPNACPLCGPQLELWDCDGKNLATGHEALLQTADFIRKGKIVAVKGLGGFQLVVDARNERAIQRLRERKLREEKPFAMMFPTIECVKEYCEVFDLEERLLRSPESPITLLRKNDRRQDTRRKTQDIRLNSNLLLDTCHSSLASNVAPGNPYLGIMLPYTPLHHLLMKELGFPVVATSGNLSNEPICIDEHEALDRLNLIADIFLVHNRPIARHVDDSIVRMMAGREMILRRARGYAPLPIHLRQESVPVLAVGAHLKNTIAVSMDKNIFVSQHVGDLETVRAYDAFEKTISDFKELYQVNADCVTCDFHPDYRSTRYAKEKTGLEVVQVQHHYAHVLSCMSENEMDGTLLGVAWDGAGYGMDGTVWGGEFLHIEDTSFRRAAQFRTFRLPGGEKSVREPRRTAMGILYEIFGDEVFEMKEFEPVEAFMDSELKVLREMLKKGVYSPMTSSVGRLFDAVSALLGLRQVTSFEGQAAMDLEFVMDGIETDESYPIIEANQKSEIPVSPTGRRNTKLESFNSHDSRLTTRDALIIDWDPMLRGILKDFNKGISAGQISAKFHNTLVETIVLVAKRVGEERIVLAGGCFQNKYLCERAVQRLREENFRPYWHQRVPPNDGGISLGQVMAVSRQKSRVRSEALCV